MLIIMIITIIFYRGTDAKRIECIHTGLFSLHSLTVRHGKNGESSGFGRYMPPVLAILVNVILASFASS